MIKITNSQRKLIEGQAIALATCNLENELNVIAVACCKVVGGQDFNHR